MIDEEKTKKPKAYCKAFTMVDVPIHIVRDFCGDVESKYGNIYWVKLLDLMRKAEAYDMLVSSIEEVEDNTIEEKKESAVMTFAGEVKR